MPDIARIAGAFARARWGHRFANREALLAWQQRRIDRFVRDDLPRVEFYRRYRGASLCDLPIVDKPTMLANFAAFNVGRITLDRALDVALAAEQTRDFAPTIDGLTVGLSSGTSGTRGVFLVSPTERAQWAGLILARVLGSDALRRILNPVRRPVRVAFFLRANSNLYESVGSRRLRFAFYDLIEPFELHLQRLRDQSPDLLVAPATVLRRLAESVLSSELKIAPSQVVSVAEVLEPDDRALIEREFGVRPQEIYQATEGFLGASCPGGRIHLNEEFVHIEPEWLDSGRRHFRPIVTDFSRTTQVIVRYRLDDVLLDSRDACACGRVTRSLDAMEGRADDILWQPSIVSATETAIFPDALRRSMAVAGDDIRDYRIEQRGEAWRVRIDADPHASTTATTNIRREIEALCRRLDVQPPVLAFEPWRNESALDKRRRIRCLDRAGRALTTV
jgi:putative adenylate-forming enzyme